MKLFTSTDIQKIETAKVIAVMINVKAFQHYNTHLYYIIEEASQIVSDLYYERLECDQIDLNYQLSLFNFKSFEDVENLDKHIKTAEKILNDLFNKDFD